MKHDCADRSIPEFAHALLHEDTAVYAIPSLSFEATTEFRFYKLEARIPCMLSGTQTIEPSSDINNITIRDCNIVGQKSRLSKVTIHAVRRCERAAMRSHSCLPHIACQACRRPRYKLLTWQGSARRGLKAWLSFVLCIAHMNATRLACGSPF